MSEKDDGGPAFPVSPDAARGKVASIHGGMTLRDYFAAKAMGGASAYHGQALTDEAMREVAEQAYCQADAMLEARKK